MGPAIGTAYLVLILSDILSYKKPGPVLGSVPVPNWTGPVWHILPDDVTGIGSLPTVCVVNCRRSSDVALILVCSTRF